jgi:hypothetical protein
MPSASRNERKKRRVRRNLTLMKRMAYQQATGRLQALGALFTILSNAGGEIEVSEEQLVNGTNLLKNGRLVVERKDKDVEGSPFVIRIATADEVQSASTPAFVPDPSLLVEEAQEPIGEGDDRTYVDEITGQPVEAQPEIEVDRLP